MLNLNSNTLRKTLNYFFLNEAKRVYVNELARLLSEDPKNLHRTLVKLENIGILSSEFIGKERFFFVNKNNPLYKEYKTIFIKTAGIETILSDALKKITGLKIAYLYGSYANQKFTSTSDIDLLLIGEHSILDTQKILAKIQRISGREINAIHMSTQEFELKKKNKDHLITSILKSKPIKIL